MSTVSAAPTEFVRIRRWRDPYRLEMSCQIINDSIHDRDGWTQEYLLVVGDTAVGYGSIAKDGPWSGRPAVYEWYVVAPWRTRIFELFRALLVSSAAVDIEVQSNDMPATVMLHTFAQDIRSEAILFEAPCWPLIDLKESSSARQRPRRHPKSPRVTFAGVAS